MKNFYHFLKKHVYYYKWGKKYLNSSWYKRAKKAEGLEMQKQPSRTEVINFWASFLGAKHYLEIGVRNPADNFDHIAVPHKISVDPGLEFKDNPVTYKLTSDSFFENLRNGSFKELDGIKFDIVFIDGLHLSNQVDRDITNALDFLTENGVLVLHDCNPPSIHHQRENFNFHYTPAGFEWNGTTWKAFYHHRFNDNVFSACVDCNYGVGLISRIQYPLFNRLSPPIKNCFYEYDQLIQNRSEDLNLIKFEDLNANLPVKHASEKLENRYQTNDEAQ